MRGWDNLNKVSQLMYKETYFLKDETYDEWLERVCSAYASDSEHKRRMKNYIRSYWFHPATPISSNAGTDRGLPISCFVRDIEDSKEGIFYGYNEGFWLGSRGTGIGTNWDKVREIDAPIGPNGMYGTSSGVIPFLGVSDRATLAVSQGSLRRASESVFLSISHPEILEFIDIRKSDRDPNRSCPNLHHGVLITDAFMNAMLNRSSWDLISRKTGEVVTTVDAFDLWCKILDVRTRLKGEPYLIFIDTMNKNAPEEYKELNMPIRLSNLCVTGDTKILTTNGYKPIESLANTTTECWNGTEWSWTDIFQTSKGQEVLKVKLSNTIEIEATPYHKWYVMNGYNSIVEKRTIELEPDDKLVKFNLEPVTHGSLELPLAYENGFHSGDGTVYTKNNSARISLHDEKKLLVNRFYGYRSSSVSKEGRIINLHYAPYVLLPKFTVPSSAYTVDSRLRWLAGYVDADGTLTSNNGTESIQIGSINLPFLQEVLLLLQELGVHSTISKLHDARYTKLPANDGTGTYNEYWCKESYRLLIAGSNLNHLMSLGFTPSRVTPTIRDYQREARQFIKVVSVVNEGKVVPTYCGTEPKNHKLMFNGILTGNCTEIALNTEKDKANVCCLGSMNLEYWDEWRQENVIDTFIYDCLDFLDNVLESFINKTEGLPGFERARKGAIEDRPLGLGVMGFHSYLQKSSVAWETPMAVGINRQIFHTINRVASKHNIEMAKKKGECPTSKRSTCTPKRNIVQLAIAPTMSISNLMDMTSGGVEPILANFYLAKIKQGSFVVKNKYLNSYFIDNYTGDLNNLDKWLDTQWEIVIKNQGSVQSIDWMSSYYKDVFKTAFEIDQQWIVSLAADRQQYIDQSQSINLFYPAKSKVVDVYNDHVMAWRKGLKALYYLRSNTEIKASTGVNERKRLDIGDTECLSCQ